MIFYQEAIGSSVIDRSFCCYLIIPQQMETIMPEKTDPQPVSDQPEVDVRKPYHTPQIEDYGAVNELTRSAIDDPYSFDGVFYYNSSIV